MKSIIFLFATILMLSAPNLKSQITYDSNIEIKISIIKDSNENRPYTLAIVSVINRGKDDIYVPGLRYQVYWGIQVFKKVQGLYREIQPDDKSPNPDLLLPVPSSNFPPMSYIRKLNKVLDDQKEILDHYIEDDSSSINHFSPPLGHNNTGLYHLADYPIFLHTGQTLSNVAVINCTKAFSEAGEYKISFTYDKSKVNYKSWPEIIFKYHLDFPDSIRSDDVHYNVP